MSAPAVAGVGRPTVRFRGTVYPVLLPSWRDPRLHLAAVTISLHLLGQVAFDFRLSIAQILIAVGTAAAIEVTVTAKRSHVLMWPASAMLTGNGIAFILRVPGTEHGDWWSLKGWWLYAGTSAVAIGSKYLVRFRGRHVFNPSNGALVLTFLLFGPEHADPLEFWWAPMSPWLALALGIIVAGGFAILRRLRLLSIAVTFWVTFALALGVVALAGHEMTARWHLGALTGASFWRAVVLSPEILVFMFFMITDPKTTPVGTRGRRAYAVAVALLAAVLIAPATTEFWSKVAVLGALVIVCAARVPLELLGDRVERLRPRAGMVRIALAGAAAVGVGVLLVVAGVPARPGPALAAAAPVTGPLPAVTVVRSNGVASAIDRPHAERIAADLVADLAGGPEAVRTGSSARASTVAAGDWLAGLLAGVGAPESTVARYEVDTLRLSLERSTGQAPPKVIAEARGSFTLGPASGTTVAAAERRTAFRQTFELVDQDGRWVISRSRVATPALLSSPVAVRTTPPSSTAPLGSVRLVDVSQDVGLDFRHGSFRFGMSADAPAMMGGGLCWLDVNGDGWMDLYATNSYADADLGYWGDRGGPPPSRLFLNDHGRFADAGARSGAELRIRANGCVAADFDGDGRTDLYVTAVGADALLLNRGGGRFVDVAQQAGISGWGWHSGATVGDVNGDGRPDLFVAGYTDPLTLVPGSIAGFPTNHVAIADRLYLNVSDGGALRFREVAKAAGIEAHGLDHGLGAVFTDANRDGRLDLFVANDEDPNRLYLNEPRADDPAGLGFRLVDRAAANGVADANAGMGVVAEDLNGDGLGDLLVTNSRDQLHAVDRGTRGTRLFADARAGLAAAFDTRRAGWGVAAVDLDDDGRPDLALANGGIPITSLAHDAQPLQILANNGAPGGPPTFVDATASVGLAKGPVRNGRGLAVADFDNDGRPDIAVSSIGGRLVLLRTTGSRGHWLEVGFARFSPGAVVTVELSSGRTLVQEVHAGSSYLSSDDPRLHFGLGRAERVARLTVRFPDGSVERRTGVAADQLITVGG